MHAPGHRQGAARRTGRLRRVGAKALLLVLNLVLLVRYRRLTQRFLERMRHLPNLAAPATFTEKIHWRKIFDDDPRFAIVLDKLKAKQFVRDRLPGLHAPALLWQGDDPRDIPFDRLDVPYIVKCNHGCAMNAVVADPAHADRAAIIAEMTRHLAVTYGQRKLERGYALIRPRVFVEALIGRDQGYEPVDYKFNVVGGRVGLVVVTAFRSTVRRTALFDRDWRRLPVAQAGIDATLDIARPRSFLRMVEAAETLGSEFDMIRVDFYEDAGEPVFGEFAIYPRSGLQQFDPPSFDLELGARWDIARSRYLSRPQGRFARWYRAALAAAGHV